MKIKQVFYGIAVASLFASCAIDKENEIAKNESGELEYVVEQFADIRVMRYQIPGFDELSLKEKQLVYYLTQAGLAGRDIIWDQNYRHNLKIRKTLERINHRFRGDKKTEDWKAFRTYFKRVWFSNGIHHHYSNDKIKPAFSKAYFQELLQETRTKLSSEVVDVIFDDTDAKKVNKKAGVDNVLASAVNFYGADITSKDVVDFYEPLAEEKNITLKSDLEITHYHGDKDLLFQAFANILDNAIKFTPVGGHITVTLGKNAGRISVVVQDSGSGIADGDIDKIFGRFYRAEQSRNLPGAGLGLSLVSAVIHLHAGQVMARNIKNGFQIITIL